MSTVLGPALLGALSALPLLVGAWLTLSRRPSMRTVGRVSAFGAGALVSAVSFELVLDAVGAAPPAQLATALGAGAVVYYIGDRLLTKGNDPAGHSGRGRALMMGAVLDGIPESFILGLSVVAGGGISAAFLVAVLVSNFPEGMASTAELADEAGESPNRILLMWLAVVGVAAIAASLGAAIGGSTPYLGAMAEAFAAGALLTMLIDDLIPEARQHAGIAAGLLGVFGFAVALALHQIGG